VAKARKAMKTLKAEAPPALRPDPANARLHPPRNRALIRQSLEEVGGGRSILVDGDGVIRAGNGVYAEAADLGIPVRVVDASPDELIAVRRKDLTGAAAERAALLDNRAAELATWDGAALAELRERAPALLDGLFESGELDALLASLAAADGAALPAPGAGGDEFDPTPEEAGPTRTQAGDLWVIGGVHRLLVGDCTDPANVMRLMGGERAALCFTSPPYAEQREYGGNLPPWDTLMRGAFAVLPIADDGQVLVNLGLIHRDGEWLPYWDSWVEWMRGRGWRRFGWYVWDQGYGLPGDWNGRLAPSHEFVFHFNRLPICPVKVVEKDPANVRDRTGDTTMRGDLPAGRHWSSGRASLQTHKIADSVFRIQRQCGRVMAEDHHPAVYPVGLPSIVIRCWPGVVYDPFLGSGTTIIAAHRLGRCCYGLELKPRYCDVILRRAEAEGLACELADRL
jgi:DNA modification methylase